MLVVASCWRCRTDRPGSAGRPARLALWWTTVPAEHVPRTKWQEDVTERAAKVASESSPLEPGPTSRRNPWPSRLLVLVALVVAVGAGYWAGRTAMAPPTDPLASASSRVTYTVVEQTISRSLNFTAVAEWETVTLPGSGWEGTVTTLDFEPGESVAAGRTLFTLGLRPVVVARGSVPAFRDLSRGTRGADVAQLQELLTTLELFDGDADGVFAESTEIAARAFQRQIDVVDDGVIRRGDLLFVPELPARLVPTESLVVGASLTGGEPVVARLPTAPQIVIPLSLDQRGLVPASGSVVVTYPGGVWHGVIARAVETTAQTGVDYELVLEAADGGALCGGECDRWIPPGSRLSFEAEIEVVPETTGPVVPTAALMTAPDGSTTVEGADGRTIPVDVIASTGGLAVVDGIDVGDLLVLPFRTPAP